MSTPISIHQRTYETEHQPGHRNPEAVAQHHADHTTRGHAQKAASGNRGLGQQFGDPRFESLIRFGAFDLGRTPSQRDNGGHRDLLDPESIGFMIESFTPGAGEFRCSGRIGDLRRLPLPGAAVRSLTMMSTPYCFVRPSRREPRFTVSPMTV